MTTTKRLPDSGRGLIWSLALLFFALCTWTSYARWADFEYRTFDLAYYVQAIWQLVHGRLDVSVEGVPLLGNHVEPIVLLFAPIFFLFRHPLVFVVVQNAALASMGPVAFQVGRRLGLDRTPALLLAGALLLAPAAGYIALHEFHPEALTAPLVLLIFHARLRGSLAAHWVWIVALLACKENMALLLAAYCAVHLVIERKRPLAELRAWYLWPFVVAVFWFFLCTKVITPALNPGDIDYLALYDRLGASAGEILRNAITQPQRIIAALSQSLGHGNLLWALLLPFLALPILKPHWLLIAAPILLQHLLSWRSSEWTIYFHYAAPLLPLFWIALAQAVAGIDRSHRVPISVRRAIPMTVLAACISMQIFVGPAGGIIATTRSWVSGAPDRARKTAFIRQIAPGKSVLAPLPYLSHLAMREKLYSLHYVLKGLKTLSRSTYEPPPPTDFVLIDYDDSATFDPEAGYYHPAMKTVDGRVIPSSERLLHDFLKRCSWSVNSTDELTLLRQTSSAAEPPPATTSAVGATEIDAHTTLTSITKSADVLSAEGLEITTSWSFQPERETFPWMFLKLTPRDHGDAVILSRGLCAPEITSGSHQEKWRITFSRRIPPGEFDAEAFFVDNSKLVWAGKSGLRRNSLPPLSVRVSLGQLEVETSPK
ncbi:MAG: hypothetical protein QOD12_2940 [Verrucomicrobiota bacterium]